MDYQQYSFSPHQSNTIQRETHYSTTGWIVMVPYHACPAKKERSKGKKKSKSKSTVVKWEQRDKKKWQKDAKRENKKVEKKVPNTKKQKIFLVVTSSNKRK